MNLTSPKILLHAEGAAVLIASCVLYSQIHGSWLWFAVLLLTPDLSMLGYAAGVKAGARCYNVVHTYAAPLLFLGVLWITGHSSLSWLGIIWTAHIGMDRMMGYGLKYETEFKDTHLNRV